jgi:hypothetical protein
MPLRKTTRQFIPTPSLGPGRQSTEGHLVWYPPPDALPGLPQAVLWPPPVSQSAEPSQKAAQHQVIDCCVGSFKVRLPLLLPLKFGNKLLHNIHLEGVAG